MLSAQMLTPQTLSAIFASPAFSANPKLFLDALCMPAPSAPPSMPTLLMPPTALPEAATKPKAEAEKKLPSAWILFSGRAGKLVREAEHDLPKEQKTKTGTLVQFSAFLWTQKKEWSDAEILAAWPEFTPPEVSKQAAAGKNKRPASTEEAPKKERKPQSDETKAAAAAKRAATKAKLLDPWTHEGQSYLKNARGDVVSEEGEWVGHFDGSAITATPEPADFVMLTVRD
jgi:hypothetical protein